MSTTTKQQPLLMRAATTLLLAVLTCATAWAQTTENVSYIDADGNTQSVTATVLTGSENSLGSSGQESWYIVNSNIEYSSTITVSGEVHLILSDNTEMKVTTTSGNCISATAPLTIYGQSAGSNMGRLTLSNNDGDLSSIFMNNAALTINGGYVNIVGDVNQKPVYVESDYLTINGGKVTTSKQLYSSLYISINGGQVEAGALYVVGSLQLGCRNDTDYIRADSYIAPTVTIADGQVLTDGSNFYSGTLSNDEINAIAGKTLSLYDWTNNGDGSYTIHTAAGWDFFCDALQDNDTYNHFSGKTVKLGADITVTRMAGGSDHAFVGTFDGQGHTLTVNYGSASAPLDAQFVAPFVEVRGDAEFFNLTIDGHIYATPTPSTNTDHDHAGGLIGHLFGSVTIEHCTSRVSIFTTNEEGAGGFVGLCEHAVTFNDCRSSAVITSSGGNNSGFVGWSRNSEFIISFEGCLFNGKILKKDNVGSGNGGFVGWKGDNKTVYITNCLVAPAALDEGETMADGNSATFSYEHADYPATITNCYYIEAFGREQGTQAYSISKGEYVTTLEISGEPTNSYPVSGLDYYSVGLKCGDVLYAAVNNVVSLTLGCTPPSGYHFTGYTATGGTLDGTTLTMPNGNVTIDATIEQLTPVDYVDENGVAQQCTDYILLTGTETYLGTPDHPDHETWYVVQGTLNYTKTLRLIGNTHIILADNAVMNGTGISPVYSGPSFSIYGQTGQSGELNVTSASQYALHVFGNITIAGGKVTASARYGIFAEADDSVTSSVSVTIKNATVTATGTGTNAVGIGTQDGDITIDNSNVTATAQGTAQCMAFRLYGGGNVIFRNGGKTRAEGDYCGIFCQGNVTIEGCQVEIYGGNYGIETNNITLGWTNPTDYIYANSYIDMQSDPITIATGKTFKTEDGHTYSGTIAMEYGTYPINGKTLYPNCVVMKQVEGYGDGNGGWVFIASPVAGSIAPSGVHNLIATTEEDYDLYRFNQSDPNGNEWQNWKATTEQNHPDFTELVNGQGYLYATKETRTLVFAGEYNTDNEFEVPLVYDPDADLAGWNLVGNPFTVNATSSQPFYRMNEGGTALSAQVEAGNTVEAMEGVFVQATAANQVVTFTAQTRGGEKSAVAALNIKVGLSAGTESLDNAIIRFDGGQTLEKFSFRENSTKIYIPQDGTDYAIACAESTGEIPLNFKAKENGTYTLTVSTTLNSQLSTLNYLHLIDNMTGADVDLLTPAGNSPSERGLGGVYTFTAKTTDYESRFKLVFAVGSSTGSDTFAFISNGNIIVNGEGTLQIFDAMGRQLFSKELSTFNSQLSTLNYTPGVYVLRLINGEHVRTQKIVVE